MREVRRRSGSSTSESVGLVALGALAGLALGMVIADRVGGIDGLLRRAKRRAGPLVADMAIEEEATRPDGLDEFSAHEFEDAYDDDLDDEDADDDSEFEYVPRRPAVRAAQPGALAPEVLEERVLEVFRNDPELAECSIDISAGDEGVIELAGWVANEADIEHALTLARGVPEIGEVVSLLAVKRAR